MTASRGMDWRPVAICALAALAAVGLGLLVAERPRYGVGLTVGLLYGLLGVRHPLAAVALWVPSFFLSFLPGGNELLQVGFPVALVAAGVAYLGRSSELRRELARVNRPLLLWMALLTAWTSLSLLWARSPGAAFSELWKAGLALLVTIVVACVVREERHLLWLVGALAGGAVLSALIGLVGGETIREYAAGNFPTTRLAGGAGDANQLASSLVPAIALLLALSAAVRHRGVKVLALAGIVVAGIGLGATQSRGGLIALAIMAVLALLFAPGARLRALGVIAASATTLLVYFTLNPEALERVGNVDDEGTGRSDLWRVGWRMVGDHPLGVGLDNFRQVSADYALSPGGIERINQIVDQPIVAHNTFLQVLAELGLVGLVLYLGVIVASALASRRAWRHFSAAGRPQMALLAQLSVVALLGFMASSLFVTFTFSYRLWALIGLGPALLTVALRSDAPAAPAARAPATR
jgi:O-antigen ligase